MGGVFVWNILLALPVLCLCKGFLQKTMVVADELESSEEITRNRRVIGGKEVTHGDWPFLVFVGTKLSGNESGGPIVLHHCGGTLITPYHVLTASHCMIMQHSRDALVVLAGYTSLPAHGDPAWDKAVDVEEYHQHPHYSDTLKFNDIGVLKLARPIMPNGVDISTIPLNAESNCPRPRPYEQCMSAGWGVTSYSLESKGNVSNKALEVSLTIVDNDVCNSLYGHITADKLCAGELGVGMKDTCSGDSGGPLVCECDGELRVAGVVSYGQGCALPDRPGIYSRVSYNLPWLESVIRRSFIPEVLPVWMLSHSFTS